MNPELKRIPAPVPGVVITVPLKLLPAYLKLHKLESVEYKEVEETLIIKRITPLARITAERDEYKRQAKLYNEDMMRVRAQRDELRIIAKKLVGCFVVDVECDWWKPNPLTPMSERDIALTELAAALKQSS